MVSVIIPIFNRRAVLARALDSVRAQTMTDWELIAVDDGSTDNSADIFRDWVHRHQPPQRTLLLNHAINRGVSASRNYAASAAQGEWLAFLDSDDEWLPEKLKDQLACSAEVDLVHGEEIWIRDGVRVNAMKKHAKSGGRIFCRCVDLCCISPSATLLRRKLFENLGGFREDFPVCEDYELWLRVCARGAVGFVRDPVVRKYGGHADQLSRQFKGMDYYRVKALMPFIEKMDQLTSMEYEHVIQTIRTKCAILLSGYRKHGNMTNYDEVSDWARKAEIQCQIAHSAAERRPRSLDNFTL